MVCRCLLIAAVCCALPMTGWGQAVPWDGSTTTKPSGWTTGQTAITIGSAAELAWVAKKVNDGEQTGNSDTEKGFTGCTLTLTEDIDLNNHPWTPIGTGNSISFKGSFNGGNHTIRNLCVSAQQNAGLFGNINPGSDIEIKNLGIFLGEDGISTEVSNPSAGGIAGSIKGEADDDYTVTISNCFVTGSLIRSNSGSNGSSHAGGLIGNIYGRTTTIKNCYANVETIEAATDANMSGCSAGGLVGTADMYYSKTMTMTGCLSCCGKISSIATHDRSNGYAANLIGKTGFTVIFENCFSSPFTAQTVQNGGTYPRETTYPVGTSSDANGALLTSANFDEQAGHALAGWTNAGWTIHADRQPTLDAGAASEAISQFMWDGDGSEADPFQINSEDRLHMITRNSYYLDKFYKITNSFSLTTDWTPLKDFAGVFDGNGYIISALKIPQSKSAEAAGLFANLKSGAKVSNLGVVIKDEVIAEGGSAESGGIAGKCESGASIENCFVADGKITGKAAGSIAGTNEGTIYGCYATTEVAGIANASIGGISGSNTGTIQNSYAIGKIVETDASNKAGGISGTNTGTIENCLALNKEGISGTTGQGRITGENTGTLTGNQAYPLIPGTWTNEGADQTDGALWEGDSYPFPATRAITVWDMTTDPTLLPRLQAFIDKETQQPADNLKKAAYQTFKVTLTPTANGTITATYTGGSLVDGENIHIPGNTVLTLTATPDAGFQLKTFTADDAPIGNTHTVIANVTLSATFEPIPAPPVTPDPDPVPDPSPTVYYTVTLPAVEGATTDPVAGEYEVEAWGSFRFYLTLDKEYDKSEPVVKTDRFETITPRSSDGAYVVKYVRNDVEIFIDGIVKNPDPVGNEVVATDAVKVWAAKGNLHISTVTGQTARVYNLAGSLVKQAEIPAGDTLWPLPSGIYIVQIADTRYKVIL